MSNDKSADLLPVELTTDDMGLYIHGTMPDGSRNMIFDIRVRGWGGLTGQGQGGRKMTEEEAIAVQKMWADEMCKRWNTSSQPQAVAEPIGYVNRYYLTDGADEYHRNGIVMYDQPFSECTYPVYATPPAKDTTSEALEYLPRDLALYLEEVYPDQWKNLSYGFKQSMRTVLTNKLTAALSRGKD